MGGFVAAVAILLVIFFLSKTFFSKDRVTIENSVALKGDAKIINVSHKKVGRKGAYHFRTIITFDDGFVFEADDTERVDHFATYDIYIDQKMNQDMISRAKEAHARVCERYGISRPTKPFVCGKCGHEGPYKDKCPICSSSLKRYINN